MAQAAIKVGQAFVPIEVDFTGIDKRVAKNVAKAMNYASRSATIPIRPTMFAGAAPAFTRAITRTNFASDALFKGKFANRINKGLSMSLAQGLSGLTVPANTSLVGGFSNAFHKGFSSSKKIEPGSMFKGGLGGFGGFGRAAATAFAAAFTVGGALSARTAVMAYGQYEQAQVGLSSMLKDAGRANKLLSDIQNFAVVSPFNMQNLIDASKQMTAFGFQTEQIIPIMHDIGDTAAALGTGDEGIQRMIRAMGQIKVKGRVMAEELLQLTEIGVNAPQFLADHLGVSVREALDLVHKGVVDSNTAITALRNGMRKNYAGMMDDQSKTLFGLWANLKDQFEIASRMLITPFGADIKGWLKSTIDAFERIRKWAETDWPGIVARFREDPKGQFKAAAQALWDAFKERHWPKLWDEIKQTIGGAWNFVVNLDLVNLYEQAKKGAARIYDAIAGVDWASATATAKTELGKLWDNVKGLGSAIKTDLENVNWSELGTKIQNGLGTAWGTVKDLAKPIKEQLEQIDWMDVASNLGKNLGTARKKIVDKAQELLDVGGVKINNVLGGVDWAKAGQDAGTLLGSNINSFVKTTIDTGLDVYNWVKTKLDGVNWDDLWSNTSDFSTNFGTSFVASLFNISEDELKQKVDGVLGRIRNIIKDPNGQDGMAIQLSMMGATSDFTDKVRELAGSANEEFNRTAIKINGFTVEDEAEIKAAIAGGNLSAAFINGMALSVGEVADAVNIDFSTIFSSLANGQDLLHSIVFGTEGGNAVKKELGNTLGGALVNLLGSVLKLFMNIGLNLVKFLVAQFVIKITTPIDNLIKWFNGFLAWLNTFPGYDFGYMPTFEQYFRKQAGMPGNPNEFYYDKHARNARARQATGTFFGDGTKEGAYNVPGINRDLNVYTKLPVDDDPIGLTGVGKSAVVVHQHFEGRYIEPKHAQRAAMLATKLGK